MKPARFLLLLTCLVAFLLVLALASPPPSKTEGGHGAQEEAAVATCSEVWPTSPDPPVTAAMLNEDEDDDNEEEYYDEGKKDDKEVEKVEKKSKKCSPGSLALSKDLLRTLKSEKMHKENAINDFLRYCRSFLQDRTLVKLVVLGNRAADLDSIVSAISYALLQHALDPERVVIPVLNIRRERFRLRTEAAYVFKKRRIDLDLLIFKDEFDFRWHHENGLLRLVLVDHNALPSKDAYMDSSVVAVFDHHRDEGRYLNAEIRVVEPVGSCATLITREIFETCASILDRNLARILLAPIVIDTANFNQTLARPLVTVDEEVAVALLDLIEPHKYPKLQYRSVYFQKLMNAKNDVTSLTSEDLLRRDYKEWVTNGYRYGISTVPLSFEKWAEQDTTLIENFLERMRSKNLDLLVIMLVSFSSTLSRELVIFTDHNDLGDTVVHYLSLSELNLSLLKSGPGVISPPNPPEIGDPEGKEAGPTAPSDNKEIAAAPSAAGSEGSGTVAGAGIAFYIFNQNNTKVSRKTLQPLLQNIFQEMTPNPRQPAQTLL